jgi:hypothetical protein
MRYAIISNYSGYFLHVTSARIAITDSPTTVTTYAFRHVPQFHEFAEAVRLFKKQRAMRSSVPCSVVAEADLVCFASELDRMGA